jgi:hypothetical protein
MHASEARRVAYELLEASEKLAKGWKPSSPQDEFILVEAPFVKGFRLLGFMNAPHFIFLQFKYAVKNDDGFKVPVRDILLETFQAMADIRRLPCPASEEPTLLSGIQLMIFHHIQFPEIYARSNQP